MAGRALSVSPITYLGRISYATYLWHWPIVVLVALHHNVSPLSMFFISGVGATRARGASASGCSSTRSARSAVLDRYPGPVIASVAGHQRRGRARDRACDTRGAERDREHREGLVAGREDSPDELTRCSTGTPRRTTSRGSRLHRRSRSPSASSCTEPGPAVLLMGDSLARMWTPGVRGDREARLAHPRHRVVSRRARGNCSSGTGSTSRRSARRTRGTGTTG